MEKNTGEHKGYPQGEAAEVELEGGGASWWYVCSECHGVIDEKDHYCRHCGKRLCLPLELK